MTNQTNDEYDTIIAKHGVKRYRYMQARLKKEGYAEAPVHAIGQFLDVWQAAEEVSKEYNRIDFVEYAFQNHMAQTSTGRYPRYFFDKDWDYVVKWFLEGCMYSEVQYIEQYLSMNDTFTEGENLIKNYNKLEDIKDEYGWIRVEYMRHHIQKATPKNVISVTILEPFLEVWKELSHYDAPTVNNLEELDKAHFVMGFLGGWNAVADFYRNIIKYNEPALLYQYCKETGLRPSQDSDEPFPQPKTETFYMVFVEHGRTPTKKHTDWMEADAEAQRLSLKLGRKAWVLATVRSYEIIKKEEHCLPRGLEITEPLDDLPF